MVCDFNDMQWDFEAMLRDLYAMRNWNVGLNNMVCYALLWHTLRFEQKGLISQSGSKHFSVEKRKQTERKFTGYVTVNLRYISCDKRRGGSMKCTEYCE